jgi:alpha-L-rhamnosidase
LKSNYIVLTILLLTNLLITSCSTFQNSTLIPYDLRCEYLQNPMGIENPTPALSWKIRSSKNNINQTAYHILVSSSKTNLDQNIGDLWDTNKVISNKNLFITYSGKKLSSGEKVFYKVRVWDDQGDPSGWSEIQNWQMGLINSVDWKAKWIGQGEDQFPDSFKTEPAPYFRKEFSLNKKIKFARVHVSGLGYYELYLNGKKISDNVLVPAQTNYDKRSLKNLTYHYDDQSTTRVFYNTYDVTDHIIKNNNAIGMILGNGWYNERERRAEGWIWYNTPRLILQLEIEYVDGEKQTIISDSTWKVSTGPIIYNQIFTGEIYDARLELNGWSEVGFDETTWNYAKSVIPPSGELQSQLAPPDKAIKSLQPISISNPKEGVYIYDIGQMISGWAKLNLKGLPGDTISMRYIEEMGGDYGQKDTYILKGDSIELYEPRFTWHAFRHIEVSGANTELSINDLEAIVVNTAVDTVGSFECSNDLFNKIYRNYIWTQLGNFHGSLSSDCPHRERLGYTGDGQLLVESSIFNFDMTQFYKKWINDMDDARNKKTGYVPHSAPFGGGGGGPAWGSSYVIVPWLFYQYYGDKSVLIKHYSGMKQWVDYLGTRTNENGIVVREEPNGWCLGDWATPNKIEIPEPLVNTSFYFHCTDIMSKVALLLEKDKDKLYFDNLKRKIKSSFNNEYFNENENRYWTSYQGADVFPLSFGMVPDEKKEIVFQTLTDQVKKNKEHLDTGILATPLLLEVLTDMGREDLAFTIMNQRDYPGFGHYILGKGATTLWENWDGKNSHSHPMYGSVIRWFYKALAGINPDPKEPGFKHILIKPVPCGDLTYVKADYNSLYGLIKSEWKIENNNFQLDIEIPPNTSATVHIPAMRSEDVFAKKPKNAIYTGFENNRAIYEVGSGKHTFTSKQIDKIIKPVHLPGPQIIGAESLIHQPNKALITLKSYSESDIYFTLDGSEPTQDSKKYSMPIELKEIAFLKTRTYQKGFLPSHVKEQKIRFVDPRENGLKYTVYEGTWTERPDLEKINPVSTGKTFEFDVNKINRRDDWVAIKFEGYIEIKQEGEYTFYSSANDGSVVYLNDKIVVDNAGYKGANGIKNTKGKTYLSIGKHKLELFYYENDGTESLDFEIEGPGIKRQQIPMEIIFFNK